MAAKTGWHRYDTKLRHCHAMYTLLRPVVWVALCNRLQSSHLGDCSVLPAWRYASVVLAHVAWCLSVCLYVCHNFTSRCSVETPGWCELVFGIETSFDLSCTVLREIWVSPTIRVIPSETLYQILNFEIFATARRSSQRVVNFVG